MGKFINNKTKANKVKSLFPKVLFFVFLIISCTSKPEEYKNILIEIPRSNSVAEKSIILHYPHQVYPYEFRSFVNGVVRVQSLNEYTVQVWVGKAFDPTIVAKQVIDARLNRNN